jgi:eukaryotic-like serine/threonine-protein kinase
MSPMDRRPADPQLQRAPGWWVTVAIVAVGVVYLALAATAVQPYLAPAGHGAIVLGDPTSTSGGDGGLLATRPPAPSQASSLGGVVTRVVPRSPAAGAGIVPGDRVAYDANAAIDSADVDALLRAWRMAYWRGVRGPVDVQVRTAAGQTRTMTLDRPAAWTLEGDALAEWLGLRVGVLIAIAIYVLSGLAILLLRPRAATAQFAIVAIVLCGISSGGPLLGGEQVLGWLPSRVMTMAAWLAMPLAFPSIALAVAYFPRRSPLLDGYPALHAVPFLVTAPMLITSTLTGLFICGVDGLIGAARWEATHASVFFIDFAAGLALNAAVVSEMVTRFRRIADPNDRRKVVLAIAGTVVGMVTYLIQAGAPAVSAILTGRAFGWPWWLSLPLNVAAALPALGLTYAVVVHRVLSPRNVLRQSLQYALARKTLAVAAVLPAFLLVLSLVAKRHESLTEIVTGQPLVDATLLIGVLLAFRFRVKAMAWLDRRFFRAEYDAREILVSLAGRIPFETDPHELTSLVLHQIDQALHPAAAAVLASGVEPGVLVPVSVLHGRIERLSQGGPLGQLLAWSDQPLELDLNDTRSPARRLPPDEIAWVSSSGAQLLVPLLGRERDTPLLVGAIVLGGKKSEEPYTSEDRELLSSIAAQVSLGLDVARLRRRETSAAAELATIVTPASAAEAPVAECPTCHACHDAGTLVCAVDGTALRAGAVPRTIDAKYRVDRVLGTGGMGAVYQAHDMRLDRDVAIKVVRADLIANPDARARFRREAQLIARLQHPGVVSVFDYGTLPGGAAFLVMEYVRGRDLRTLVKEGPQPPALVARLLASIADPIDAAHHLGILHRDLKPENILLPENGIVATKVLDFGIAKAIASNDGVETGSVATTLTASGQPLGTPAYMAPEQLAGGRLSERTDVYAIGVIGYELLTGDLPYGRGSFVDVALRQVEPAPTMARNDVPETLRGVIAAALSPNPGSRPASARELADALRDGPGHSS